MKKNIAVIYGSRTAEHDVSIITGVQFMENMDKEKYNIVPIYIDKDGVWYTGKELFDLKVYNKFEDIKDKLTQVLIPPVAGSNYLVSVKNTLFSKKIKIDIDVAVVSVHGMNGEDGTIQGLLELANIPYVGSGVLGSSVGMDKIAMKSIFKGNDLPILKYEYFLRSEWTKEKDEIIKKIEENLDYPVFVKPANLGSSIGISKAKNKEELILAIDIASHYDKRIIVEQGIEDIIEINCSAIGCNNDIETSVCEEPTSWEEFLTFEDKYVRGNKGQKQGGQKGMAMMDRKIPADISEDLTNEIKKLTKESFKHLNCSGVARVDFIIDKKDMKPYINEINTIPGSFSFYLWQYSDIKYPELIDRLIDIAIKVNNEKNESTYSYNSSIIDSVSKGTKINK